MGSKMSNVGRSDKAILDVRQKVRILYFLGKWKEELTFKRFFKNNVCQKIWENSEKLVDVWYVRLFIWEVSRFFISMRGFSEILI